MLIQDLYAIYLAHPSIQTDTRKLKPGDLFFALKGPNFNGNEFAMRALDEGAAYAIIDEPSVVADSRLIPTADSLELLQQLARYHREKLQIPVVAITGSNGKTTTKELVHQVLSTKYRTCTTQGNLNNHIGVPLTLLSIKPGTEIAVIEMGANHRGEIAGYCAYAMPTHGLITNAGRAHLEGFGGVEGVKKGKGELFDYLRANKGTAFIMKDYDYLVELATGIAEVKTYGTANAEITGRATRKGEFLQVEMNGGTSISEINTRLIGDYNLPNVLAAVAIGKYFAVPDESIRTAIEQYEPSNSRSQLIERGGNKVILDAYNANPSSMKAAIGNFAAMEGAEKVLLLGAMMELGDESIAEHQQLANLVGQHDWKAVVLVGGDFEKVHHRYLYIPDADSAREWVKAQHFNGASILVKGSRSMKMEDVVAGI
jgi:UDP-N-acetylmuramoyl-tripeptide--D-alanyl-D-alanine ligase